MNIKKFTLRLTEAEDFIVEQNAKLAGMSKNEYVKQMALGQPVHEKEKLAQLTGMLCSHENLTGAMSNKGEREVMKGWNDKAWLILKS